MQKSFSKNKVFNDKKYPINLADKKVPTMYYIQKNNLTESNIEMDNNNKDEHVVIRKRSSSLRRSKLFLLEKSKVNKSFII